MTWWAQLNRLSKSSPGSPERLEGALTYPVLLNCIIWKVEGTIVSPAGESENKKWMILEDPGHQQSIFDGFDNSSHSPSLRVLDPSIKVERN